MSDKSDIVLRGQVAALVQHKYSSSCIAKTLGINAKTAQRWKKECLADKSRFLDGRHYSHKGNPKYSRREKKAMLEQFSQMQPMGSRAAAPELAKRHGAPAVSARTLRREARKAKNHPYAQPGRPDLTQKHKRERNLFSVEHGATEFGTWCFNDQFKIGFPMKGSRRVPYWAKSRALVKPRPTKKFPRILHVHASMTRMRTIKLIEIEGTNMNTDKFRIVNEELIPLLCDAFEGHEFMYQHDQAPWFTSKETQRYFEQDTPSSVHVVTPLEFLPNSPDINLCESLMATVLRRVFDKRPKTFDEMRRLLFEEWLAVTPEELARCYDSLPGILKTIRKKKGGNTNR
jgi:hypothetical protein